MWRFAGDRALCAWLFPPSYPHILRKTWSLLPEAASSDCSFLCPYPVLTLGLDTPEPDVVPTNLDLQATSIINLSQALFCHHVEGLSESRFLNSTCLGILSLLGDIVKFQENLSPLSPQAHFLSSRDPLGQLEL